MEKLKKILLSIKPIFIKFLSLILILVSMAVSFFIGTQYDKINVKKNIIKIRKDQVNIAIDENNHLIIIDNKTGDYIIYQDSIGQTIFKLYSKNIWIK